MFFALNCIHLSQIKKIQSLRLLDLHFQCLTLSLWLEWEKHSYCCATTNKCTKRSILILIFTFQYIVYVGPHHRAEVKSFRVVLSHSRYSHNVLRLITVAFKGKRILLSLLKTMQFPSLPFISTNICCKCLDDKSHR